MQQLPTDYIGMTVRYFDYLKSERYGRIINIEHYKDDIFYIYIEDEEEEFNAYDIIINGEMKKYAEIRLSTEVYLDEDGKRYG